jgi:hypothetical protein
VGRPFPSPELHHLQDRVEQLEARLVPVLADHNLTVSPSLSSSGPAGPGVAVPAPPSPRSQHTLPPELLGCFTSIATDLRRIADRLDPPPPDLVDTGYIADRLGTTRTWVARMAGEGTIPRACVVEGTGNGKPWRFHRHKIDQWIATR